MLITLTLQWKALIGNVHSSIFEPLAAKNVCFTVSWFLPKSNQSPISNPTPKLKDHLKPNLILNKFWSGLSETLSKHCQGGIPPYTVSNEQHKPSTGVVVVVGFKEAALYSGIITTRQQAPLLREGVFSSYN